MCSLGAPAGRFGHWGLNSLPTSRIYRFPIAERSYGRGTNGPPGLYWAAKSPLPPCIHASMHPCLHASMPPCLHASMHTIVYASSYVYSGLVCCMLWVAGGKCVRHRHRITATAAPLVTLPYPTLPYLTLPYLKLVYSISILLFITLDYPNFGPQSVAKTHKTLIFPRKTDLTRRYHCPAGPLLGLKIASVRPPPLLTRL